MGSKRVKTSPQHLASGTGRQRAAKVKEQTMLSLLFAQLWVQLTRPLSPPSSLGITTSRSSRNLNTLLALHHGKPTAFESEDHTHSPYFLEPIGWLGCKHGAELRNGQGSGSDEKRS